MNDPLDQLLADGIIDEVVARLRGGKEADVWAVRHDGEVVIAKIYKERDVRSFKNDAAYKEGRRVRNTRTQRAMDRGSRFGQAAAAEAWKSKEADALYKLHAAGLRVPKPVMFYEGVLLMELVVDGQGRPAPRLIESGLEPAQAAQAYAELRRQVVGMLACDLIHGDLSPYNVLVGRDGPIVIDFPQVIDAAHNSQAERFLLRDLQNVHRYFAALDPALRAAEGDGREIWRAYTRRELTPDFVPTGRPPPERRPPEARRGGDGGRRGQERRPGGPGGGPQRPGAGHPQGRAHPAPAHAGHALHAGPRGQAGQGGPGGPGGHGAQGGAGGHAAQGGSGGHGAQGGAGGHAGHGGSGGHAAQGGSGGRGAQGGAGGHAGHGGSGGHAAQGSAGSHASHGGHGAQGTPGGHAGQGGAGGHGGQGGRPATPQGGPRRPDPRDRRGAPARGSAPGRAGPEVIRVVRPPHGAAGSGGPTGTRSGGASSGNASSGGDRSDRRRGRRRGR